MSSTAPAAPPRSAVDARGRAIPLTDEEARGRAEAIARGLDALDSMGDAGEQARTLDEVIRTIDADPLSARKRFG